MPLTSTTEFNAGMQLQLCFTRDSIAFVTAQLHAPTVCKSSSTPIVSLSSSEISFSSWFEGGGGAGISQGRKLGEFGDGESGMVGGRNKGRFEGESGGDRNNKGGGENGANGGGIIGGLLRTDVVILQ